MIHYHGTPITPETAAAQVLAGRHAFVSFREPRQIEMVAEVCQSFALDNGAFSAWKDGQPVEEWSPYYAWVEEWTHHPAFDWAVIPDVIDGDEEANDALLRQWPGNVSGAPVWHLHESLDRLARLVTEWPRVCLGSSGDYATPGSLGWWRRMADAMAVTCDSEGRPRTKLHGLRMLDPALRRIPFASADSTNVARNIGIDSAWKGTYQPPDKGWRAVILAERIEAANAAARWTPPAQVDLFGRTA